MNDNTTNILSQAQTTATPTTDTSPRILDAIVVTPPGENLCIAADRTRVEDALLMEIARLDPDELPRLKTPLGGSTFIEINDPVAGGSAEKELIINLLAYRKNRRFFSKTGEENGAGVPPDCTAYDGLLGRGHPGVSCATCNLAQRGSGRNGKGEACEDRLDLYFLRAGCPIPMVFSLSPSSARAISLTLVAILGTGAPLHSFILKLKFNEASFAGKRFAIAELTVVDRLQPEQVRYAERLSRIVQSKIDAKLAEWGANKP